MANDLQKHEDELTQLLEQSHELGQRIDEVTIKRDQARTATLDDKLVDKARSLGVNPDNFSTEKELKEGIARFQKEQE